MRYLPRVNARDRGPTPCEFTHRSRAVGLLKPRMRKIVQESSDPSHGSSVMDLPVLPQELKKELVERIVVSPSFSKSDRLTTFLLHVCELERSGRAKEICEQRIGEAIFGRQENYDPTMDSIVRSHASRLRLRLDQYFAQEGVHETIRVRIPRGGYVPHFETVARAQEPERPFFSEHAVSL